MNGKIFFISGPSGVGKGTLINALREQHPDWLFPVSCTTREPRPGEHDSQTYHFISHEEFSAQATAGAFLEHAVVHGGHSYGTLKAPLIEGVEAGKVVIHELDVQGFFQAREVLPPNDYRSIFLVPADEPERLMKRVQERAPTTNAEIAQRTASLKTELGYANQYDHQIQSIEGNQGEMLREMEAIISEWGIE